MSQQLNDALCHIALAVDDVKRKQAEQDLKLDAISRQGSRILRQEGKLVATIDDVKTALAGEKEAIDHTVALLVDLKTKLDAAIAGGSDAAALQEISDEIAAHTKVLTDADAASTPNP